MDVYGKLKELGLTLPEAPAKGGVYTPCKLTEDGYAYISGCGPVIGGVQAAGKLGQEYSVEEGQKFAQNCMLNVLAVLEKKIGDLNRVADVVKILVFVASADDFYSQPQVANGASNRLETGKAQMLRAVIDLSGAMSIAYRVETKGYPQTSGLLTTAYEKNGNDYVYVYFFDNYTPGTMRMLRDAKGQTTPSLITVEEEKDTAYAIFTPNGAQAQYAICSPIVDENGTIYFKNDSCFLMAYGSTIKELKASTSIKTYEAGKAFSMEGVTVTATLANGEKRDVTAMMSAPTKALEVGQNEVTLTFGKDQTMYHNVNVENSNTMKTEEIAPIKVELTIRVEDPTKPIGGTLRYHYDAASGKLTVTGTFESGQTLIAACYDGNGQMMQVQTLNDVGSLTLNPSSAKIKLFLLDKDHKPVCAAVTAKG